jgi:hypothetical protein
MKRRLQIGAISPHKGSSFESNAASYPPPSAFSTPTDLLGRLRELHSLRQNSIRAGDDSTLLRSTRLFIDAAKSLERSDLSRLKKRERLEVRRFLRARDRLSSSLELLLSGEGSLGKTAAFPRKGPALAFPEDFSGFGANLGRLNRELSELHSDPSLPRETALSLELAVSSLNSRLESDSQELSGLKNSRQFIASLRLAEHYEKLACSFLSLARRRDLQGMLSLAESLGINLPKLLYSRGIYLKLGNPPVGKRGRNPKKV